MNVVQLAVEGLEEAEHDLHTMIFASQGLKLPPLKRIADGGQRASAEQIKAWASAVNARIRGRKKAAKGGKGSKLARPGGGAPPRRSRGKGRTER